MHKRRYADVSFGQVHYRTAGKGPTLLLLHQSPRTSEEYSDLIQTLAADYTVIAPDNPGNGMSDPLPQNNPAMKDYAVALVEFLDAINLDSTLIYGFHTGGSIATAAAALFPDRVRFAVTNGLAIFRGQQREDLLANYCPPIEPKIDGSHMDWLWQRFMKQAEFFPWYRTDEAARINVPPYSAAKCQSMVEDMLMAGNNYIAPYNAAFAFDPVAEGMLPADNLLIMAAAQDPLSSCLDLLPDNQKVYRGNDYADCLQTAFDTLWQYR